MKNNEWEKLLDELNEIHQADLGLDRFRIDGCGGIFEYKESAGAYLYLCNNLTSRKHFMELIGESQLTEDDKIEMHRWGF